jgi:hypothetical protein
MKPTRFVFSFALLSILLCSSPSVFAQHSYLYGVQPGDPNVGFRDKTIIVKNGMLTATWSIANEKLRGISFEDHATSKPIRLPQDAFTVVFADGKMLGASSMRISEPARLEDVDAQEQSARLEDHFRGKRVVVRLQDPNSKLSVLWSAELHEGDNYVRQQIEISSPSDVPLREVRLFDFSLPSAELVGTVNGSPVIAGNVFLGFEHPLSQCAVKGMHVRCSVDRKLPIKAGQTIRYSSVMGVSPVGQMRRGFLNYVERQRAHPYRPFLHYNSWFDIGFGKPYDQAAALDAIHGIGEELHVKRGVKLDSFLFDDGWDDPRSLWSFNSGFPNGFTPIEAAATKYEAAPGIWLSPWGGYDQAKEQRLKYGAQEGFEMNKGGFALSGSKYFTRFHDVTIQFILKYGINQFKIDGTGNVNSVFEGSQFDSDFHAAISLIEEWRALKPDVFVNLTTGTYPSPFWLRYADSIWRGGEDDDFAGVGPWREKWITYRDAATYAGTVKKGPLFPLNSLMLHGIIYARQAEHLNDDPAHAFTHEVQDYFGSGTQLQEMYISHALLSDADWDVLAEAANWSRENAATLADTHWIGGDPGKLQVYGWAAWSPEKGIITLRNPSDHPQAIAIDMGQAFELPPGATRKFRAHTPWKRDQQTTAIDLIAGESHTFTLQPFEVLTLEALPREVRGASRAD